MYKVIYLLILLPLTVFAQSKTVSGFIYDSQSNTPLIGAVAQTDNGNAVVTNEFGHYRIILSGSGKISYGYLGYDRVEYSFNCAVNKLPKSDIYLNPLILDEVEIVASVNTPLVENFSKNSMDIKTLNQVPVILGERDPMKAIAMLPGVSSAGETSSKVIVRGGDVDENLILLDGGNVYNSSHLFGLFSSFNPFAIGGVDIYKGNFPSKYDGRLSSVIDFYLQEGSFNEHDHKASIGLLTSSLKLSGSISENLSYHFSSRTAYPTYLLGLIGSGNPREKRKFNYNLWDLSGKIAFKPNAKSKLSISYYKNFDNINIAIISRKDTAITSAGWGNNLFNINYFAQLNTKTTLTSKFNISSYNFDFANEYKLEETIKVNSSKNSIDEVSLNTNFNSSLLKSLNINYGLNSKYITLSPFSSTSSSLSKDNGLELGLYANANYYVNRAFSMNIGLRANSLEVNKKYNYTNINPRLGLSYKLSEVSMFNASYSKMYQPVQQVSFAGYLIPAELWTLSNVTRPPSESNIYTLGYATRFSNFDVIVEGYYKKLSNILFLNSANVFSPIESDFENNILKNGKGRVFGAEIMLQKKIGKVNGWLSYHWSKSTRNFGEINDGKTFNHKFDKRHDIKLTLNYKLSEKWSLNSNFIVQSGLRFTAPVGITNNGIELYNQYYNGVSNPYNRLDVAFDRLKKYKNGKESKWSFGVYNAYAYPNPIYIDFNQDGYKGTSVLRFIPSISWQRSL